MNEQANPTKTTSALESPNQIIRQHHTLIRGTEYELTGVQNKLFTVSNLDGACEVTLVLTRVDAAGVVIVEDTKAAAQTKIN
jgi:hypothetical protein